MVYRDAREVFEGGGYEIVGVFVANDGGVWIETWDDGVAVGA